MYHFLVDDTAIENTIFPYKNALLKSNVKTNRIGGTKWTYLKERSFVTNFFNFFKKFNFSIRTFQ